MVFVYRDGVVHEPLKVIAPDPVAPLTPTPAAEQDVPVVGVTPHVNVAVLPNSTFMLNRELVLLPLSVIVGAVFPVVVVFVWVSTPMFTYLYVVPSELVHFIP